MKKCKYMESIEKYKLQRKSDESRQINFYAKQTRIWHELFSLAVIFPFIFLFRIFVSLSSKKLSYKRKPTFLS